MPAQSALRAQPADVPSSHVKDRVSAEEWAVRVDLAACYRLVAHFGWDDLIYTHLSARVPGPEHHFLINPFGMMFGEVTASSLVKIDQHGEIVLPTGYGINKAGFVIHGAVHEARDDAQAVLHTHTTAGVAVSAQKWGLLAIGQTSMTYTDDMAYHEYEGIALEMDERTRLVADLGTRNNMILRNHGLLTVGRTVAEAFVRMFFLEKACTAQIAALSAGYDNLHFPPAAAQETVTRQVANRDAIGGNLEWPALLRLLDRQDPSYRD
ncbi:class II aldolase/adducin family protein [Chelatococcus reniformis]|uniref:Aldolase class 2 protein n=1 Tax=Chelatococcus reniformis TaxID=1494448 RepID=A0A916XBB3_9HYPH|nr:class II aldolase/adducin family protein [Chelatococcus reniformis]GGC61264.1 putative aldolase class 2 protein [Chelatococcus reniformis]